RERPPLPYALARNEVSNGALGLLRAAFDGESPAALETLRLEFLAIYLNAVCVNSRIFNGIEIILDMLDEQGRPWGIVTNKPAAMTEPLLENLGLSQRARCVVSGDRLPERKPHPAPLILAARELGVEPRGCIYVGDAPRDIEAGRAAGMSTIAAAYGYIRPHENPHRWGADAVIRRPTDLLRACERLEQQPLGARRA
ncbi:MAG TPA: HAD-IA family hydrolase, partial [Gammaproteobacteria bacterium]|nr:HAD-IA family hydrolase [Gammaproteobacteria bacterium]